MKKPEQYVFVLVGCLVMMAANFAFAQDWPQWRGVNRDAKVTGFTAPDTWPEELNKEWEIEVGVGTDSTPALVGDRLYVFTRRENDEVLLCLNAETGEEIWQDKYETINIPSGGGASAHPGPRSSPLVADDKIVTFGVTGILSCYDINTNELLWRKDDFPGVWPQFYAVMSPIIVDGLCIGHFGGPKNDGAVVAYDFATGEQKWKWTGQGPSYSSPNIMTVEDTKIVVFMTESNIVGIDVADGKLLWQIPFTTGMPRNIPTPIIDGQTIYYCGMTQGIKAMKIEKEGDGFVVEQLWSNMDNSVEFSTPVLKDGLLFCLSDRGYFFCVNAETRQTAWIEATGRRGSYGSIVDAGSVLIGLDSNSQLVVYEPTGEDYKEIASYQVSDGQTYAYPVVSGNRIYIMDQTTIALWTIE